MIKSITSSCIFGGLDFTRAKNQCFKDGENWCFKCWSCHDEPSQPWNLVVQNQRKLRAARDFQKQPKFDERQ